MQCGIQTNGSDKLVTDIWHNELKRLLADRLDNLGKAKELLATNTKHKEGTEGVYSLLMMMPT